MKVADSTADEAFVGLDDAETRLPDRWLARRDRALDLAFVGVVVVTEALLLGALGYAAYLFLS